MKKRTIVIFLIVLLVNFVFAFLSVRFSSFTSKDIIIILFFSYVVYWFLNLYLYAQWKMQNHIGYYYSLFIGFCVSIIAIVVLIFNLPNDKDLFVVMMFVFSMFCAFLNWIIKERSNTEK